jgi:hypothetical protein
MFRGRLFLGSKLCLGETRLHHDSLWLILRRNYYFTKPATRGE